MTATPVQPSDARLRVESRAGDNRSTVHLPVGRPKTRAAAALLWLLRRPAIADFVLLSLGLSLATSAAPIGSSPAVILGLAAALALSALARTTGFYSASATDWTSVQVRRGLTTLAAGAGLFLLIAYVTQVTHDRSWLPIALATTIVAVGARAVAFAAIARIKSLKPHLAVRVALIGDEASIAEFLEIDQQGDDLIVAARVSLETYEDVRPALRRTDRVIGRAKQGEIDRVLLLTKSPGLPVVNAIVRRCSMGGVGVDLVTGATQVRSARLEIGRMHGFATMHVNPGLHGARRRAIKRVFDLVVASILMVLFAPVMVATALAVKIDSPGPILYRQSRLGRGGKRFDMIKFRSMVPGADQLVIDLSGHNEADGPLFKIQQDPRVTRVGRIIRKTSMDELPQLWNVIRGEMSLVGPRPAIPHEADGWPIELFDRLEVMPGITGLWQVSGRSDASFADYERLDLYYVDNWTLGLDLSILVRTLPAALGRGAY